jgi:hypothetical protein
MVACPGLATGPPLAAADGDDAGKPGAAAKPEGTGEFVGDAGVAIVDFGTTTSRTVQITGKQKRRGTGHGFVFML